MWRVRCVSACGLLLITFAGCRTSATHAGKVAAPPAPHVSVARPDADAMRSALHSEPKTELAKHVVAAAYEEDAAHQTPPEPPVGPPLDSINELSLERFIAEVQAVHPSLEAMYAAWQAASAKYPQVISLDDPMFGATFAPASFGSRDVESAYAIEASQKIPWHGKRALRGVAASWEADSASRDVETTRQKLAEAAELAFWDYYVTRQQLELNEQNNDILKAFRENAVSRYEGNLVTQQDVLQADVELANLEQRRIELERMDRVASGRINVLLRRKPTEPLPPPPKSLVRAIELPNIDGLLALAIEQRPDIAAVAARTQAEQAKVALACKQYYPDAEVFGRYDKFWQPTSTQSDLQGQVGARINVPIYRARLNAAVCEAMQQLAKARAEYDQLVLEVQSDVQSTFEQVRESQLTVALYSQKLLPASEQNVGVARANYDTSKITFLELAISQRQLIEARERQLQAQVELQRRIATLRRVAGGSLPDAPSPVPPPEP